MAGENEIVFEDLHGSPEKKPLTVDLDADLKDAGIETAPTGQVADDNTGNDDDILIDGLRTADDGIDAVPEDDDTHVAIKTSEDDDYSKKVKARIQRATRATRKEKDRGDYWENQARSLAKDGYDRDKSNASGIIERADSQLADTQSQLEKAIEDGNTKDQVRLTTQLTDQKAAKVRAEVTLENLPQDGNVQPYSGKVDDSTSGDRKKADDWMESHNDWYGARGFERQTRLANRLDKEVFNDGYSPDTEEYFEELDKRIKAKEPKLYDDLDADADDADTTPTPRPKRSPVAPVAGADTRRQRSSSSKVQLGEEDFANMRRFNLDPNDPEVLKEYARNKREIETQGDDR
jgi:transposase